MKLLRNKAFRTAVVVVAAFLLLSASAAGFYVLRAIRIRDAGILLSPSRPFEPRAHHYYLQNDPLWADETIGETTRSLGSAGCLISCAASAITALGVTVTPSELNAGLTEVAGFEGADLIWYKLHEAIPEITYKYSRVFSSGTIERDLEQGLLPIVNVRYGGDGVSHWVLIVGSDADGFLIYDPLNRDKTPLPLSRHGRVYSYRVLLPDD